MGIYLPNTEMPQKNQMLVIFPDGTSYVCFNGMRERLTQTTAFPVPTHGRLIDADELLPIYADLMDGGDVKPVIPKAVIDTAPTIIEAEEGET